METIDCRCMTGSTLHCSITLRNYSCYSFVDSDACHRPSLSTHRATSSVIRCLPMCRRIIGGKRSQRISRSLLRMSSSMLRTSRGTMRLQVSSLTFRSPSQHPLPARRLVAPPCAFMLPPSGGAASKECCRLRTFDFQYVYIQEARVPRLKHKSHDSRSIIRGPSGVEQLIGRGMALDQMLDQMLDCWFKRRVL